jgi:hypothetical protein
MTSLFLVTSAIYTSYGKFSTEKRIEQTFETFKSIEKYAPNSKIIALDAGEQELKNELEPYEVINYSSNLEIVSALNEYKNICKDKEPEIIIKSMLEIIMFLDFLKTYDCSSYDRIFKLSGRYKLNENFDYDFHMNSKNQVVILPPYFSTHFYNFNASTSIMQYMTRCWSFDTLLLNLIINTYEKMKTDILKLMRGKGQGDIEHLLFKYMNKNFVNNVRVMGISGFHSPFGKLIEE